MTDLSLENMECIKTKSSTVETVRTVDQACPRTSNNWQGLKCPNLLSHRHQAPELARRYRAKSRRCTGIAYELSEGDVFAYILSNGTYDGICCRNNNNVKSV